MTKGFTLIEILVVIIIIAILATLSGASLISARAKAIDIKRLADVKQMQHALDAFAQDNGGEYPTDGTEFNPGGSLVSRNGHTVYLSTIPHNPTPFVSGCAEDYVYHQGSNGKSYTLTYCLANKVSDLSAGLCTAMPGVICVQNITCSCSDITKACCGYCNSGDTCNGGTLP